MEATATKPDRKTSDGLFWESEVMRLANDPEFNRRIAADPILVDLFSRRLDEDRREFQDAQALGMCQRIAGVDVPPVRIGHFRLLTTANNAFAELNPDLSSGFSFQLEQFTEALFILHYGAQVVAPFTDVFRWRRALAIWKNEALRNPAFLPAVIEGEMKLARALQAWDAAVLRFGERHIRLAPGETVESAAMTLASWLAQAFDGLSMYPQPGTSDAQKKSVRLGRQSLRLRLSRGFVWLARRLLPSRSAGRSR
jgi:hypothetical protein